MGVSVSEGTVTKWLKNVGDTSRPTRRCSRSRPTRSTPRCRARAPASSREILVQEGETVAVGTVLARIGGEAAAAPSPQPSRPAPAPADAEPSSRATWSRRGRARRQPRRRAGPSPRPARRTAQDGGHTFVSPGRRADRGRARASTRSDPGSGRGGRVTKKDILAFVELQASSGPGAPARRRRRPQRRPRGARRAGAGRSSCRGSGRRQAPPPAPARRRRDARADERDAPRDRRAHAPLARHRRARDERDRGRHVQGRRDPRAAEGRVPVPPTASTRPTSRSSPARPSRRCATGPGSTPSCATSRSSPSSFVNLGFAVALEDGKGLIVPVLKNAEGLNLLGMARGDRRPRRRGRARSSCSRTTSRAARFTITNPGSYGTFMGTPIISQPQSGDPRHLRGRQAAVGDPGRARARTRSRSARS